MRPKTILIVMALFALLIIACSISYSTGQSSGLGQGRSEIIHNHALRDLRLYSELVELDRTFLTNLKPKSSTLSSGTYTLETTFVGSPTTAHSLELVFSNGQIVATPQTIDQGRLTKEFTQNGQIVSGTVYMQDGDEGPASEYIGIVDGDSIYGKVYLQPGQGWHEGEPIRSGFWKLQKKSKESGQ